MDHQKRDYKIGIFYIVLSFIEILESIFPWISYCQIEFSFISLFSKDKGLSYQKMRLQTYPMARESLCGYFNSTIQSACPQFCENLDYIQNGGILMLSSNLIFICIHIFLGFLFILRARKRYDGHIPAAACWTLSLLKILLGVVYFEVVGPKNFSSTWQSTYDVRLSFGFYFYLIVIVSEISVAYILYAIQESEQSVVVEEKIST